MPPTPGRPGNYTTAHPACLLPSFPAPTSHLTFNLPAYAPTKFSKILCIKLPATKGGVDMHRKIPISQHKQEKEGDLTTRCAQGVVSQATCETIKGVEILHLKSPLCPCVACWQLPASSVLDNCLGVWLARLEITQYAEYAEICRIPYR